MATRPDRIHQFAQVVADIARKEGLTGVEVYANAKTSLNGRRFQPLVDPDMNLLETPRPLLEHSEIVVHLEEPFLPRGHPDRVRGPEVD